jgi:hypothetical protein
MRTLDKKRSYGVIYGGEAKFEQDGIYFDSGGREIPSAAETSNTQTPAETRAEEDAQGVVSEIQTSVKCQEFLRKALDGGPVLKSNLYRDSQEAGLVWADVKTACAEMRLRITTRKNQEFWQLTESVKI